MARKPGVFLISMTFFLLTGGNPFPAPQNNGKNEIQRGEAFFPAFVGTFSQTVSFPEFFLHSPLVFTSINHRLNPDLNHTNDPVTIWSEKISKAAFKVCVQETSGDGMHAGLFVHWLAIGETCKRGIDSDGDGFNSCEDCDETDPSVNPNGTEFCDNQDNDCDNQVDEDFDFDGDGFTTCQIPVPDCDDADSSVNPGTV